MLAWRAPVSGSDSAASQASSTKWASATDDSRRSSAAARSCPGQELFQYADADGSIHDIASDDVNTYLREISGGDFTAKDFRTWEGTVLAYRALRALQPDDDAPASKRVVVEAMRETAGRLGNTPAVARRSYVHPAILEAYLDGSIPSALVEVAEEQVTPPGGATAAEEAAVVRLLRQRQRQERARSRKPTTRRRRRGS